MFAFTREEAEQFAAKVAATTCAELRRQGKLSPSAEEAFVAEFTPVLLGRGSVLKSLWRRYFAGDDGTTRSVMFVRMPPPEPTEPTT